MSDTKDLVERLEGHATCEFCLERGNEHCVCGHLDTILEAAAELTRLSEVVARLPVTADGVPVVLGDAVYSPSGRKHTVLVGEAGREVLYYVPELAHVDGNWRELLVHECYSTIAAAEAARGRGEW